VAAELSGVDSDGDAWSTGGHRFGILEGDAIDLRLDAAVARAATRTPDTSPSDRGPEWVRFAPRELDGHAIDRLEAWFRFAYRKAGE
jgi:hypothetical protein